MPTSFLTIGILLTGIIIAKQMAKVTKVSIGTSITWFITLPLMAKPKYPFWRDSMIMGCKRNIGNV